MIEVIQDVPYRSPQRANFAKSRHTLDLYTPCQCKEEETQEKPVVVFLHGGAWMLGDKSSWNCRQVARCFATHGYMVAVPNYRLSRLGSSELVTLALLQATVLLCLAFCTSDAERHLWVLLAILLLVCLIYFELLQSQDRNGLRSYPAQLDDCCVAVRWVIKHVAMYGGDPKQIILAGHSAGSHLANMVVMNPTVEFPLENIKALVSISGPYSSRRMKESALASQIAQATFGDDESQWKYKFPMYYVEQDCVKYRPPILLLNAEFEYGLKSHAYDYYDTLKKFGWCVERHIFHGKTHFNIVGFWNGRDHRIFEIIQRFIKCKAPTAYSYRCC